MDPTPDGVVADARAGSAPPAVTLAGRAGLGVVALALCATYAGAAFNRYLIDDDYAAFYAAWQRSTSVRGVVSVADRVSTEALALLLRWFPASLTPIYVARLGLVACVAALAVLVFRVTARVCDEQSAWFASPLFAMSVVFMNRALDLRSDLFVALLWLLTADVLAGPPLGVDSGRRRSAFRVVKVGIALASLAPLVLITVRLRASGAHAPVGAITPSLARAAAFHLLLAHDPWTFIFMGTGLVLRLDDVAAHSRSANLGALALLVPTLASVFLNPEYGPADFVTLLPLLAPFGGHACARILAVAERAPARSWLAPVTVLALLLVPLFRRLETLFDVGFTSTHRHQASLHRYLVRHTRADLGLFALEGIGVFRPSVEHYRLDPTARARYLAGEFRYEDELRARPAALVLKSTRIPAWLTPGDRSFLRKHYVDLGGDFMVPGASLDGAGEMRIELLLSGEYDVAGSGACSVDGVTVADGHSVHLEQGERSLAGGGSCRLELHVEPEARELLHVPTPVPYLVGAAYIVK